MKHCLRLNHRPQQIIQITVFISRDPLTFWLTMLSFIYLFILINRLNLLAPHINSFNLVIWENKSSVWKWMQLSYLWDITTVLKTDRNGMRIIVSWFLVRKFISNQTRCKVYKGRTSYVHFIFGKRKDIWFEEIYKEKFLVDSFREKK